MVTQRARYAVRGRTSAMLRPGLPRPEPQTMLDKKLLDLLACPLTHTPLVYDEARQELLCRASGLAYPVRDDIAVMLEDQARPLTAEEIERLRVRPV